MTLLVLNGSPRKKGTVASLLRAVAEGASDEHKVEWVDVYDLKMKPCVACMKCRPDRACAPDKDDAHIVAREIKNAGGLIVGTPTHWGNMRAPLYDPVRPKRTRVPGRRKRRTLRPPKANRP